MNYFVFLLPRRLPEHGSQLRLAQRPFSKKTVVAVNCWVRDEELQERGFYSLLGDVAPIVFDDLMDDFDTYVASIRNRIGENNNEQE